MWMIITLTPSNTPFVADDRLEPTVSPSAIGSIASVSVDREGTKSGSFAEVGIVAGLTLDPRFVLRRVA